MTAAQNTALSRTTPRTFLYLAAGLAAFSAVAYELLLASYATFLMGASIFQYSLVISLMMASMGLGAYVTKYVSRSSGDVFFIIELLLCWIAVVALPLLYYIFAKQWYPQIFILTFVVLIGGFVGMEIPLLNGIFPSTKELSRILFFDYVGGFLGGMAFPLLLLPSLGFFRVSALLATMNAAIALYFLMSFQLRRKSWAILAVVSVIVGATYFAQSENIRLAMESSLFQIRH